MVRLCRHDQDWGPWVLPTLGHKSEGGGQEIGGGLGVGAIEEDISMGSTFTSTSISWRVFG